MNGWMEDQVKTGTSFPGLGSAQSSPECKNSHAQHNMNTLWCMPCLCTERGRDGGLTSVAVRSDFRSMAAAVTSTPLHTLLAADNLTNLCVACVDT